MSIETRRNQLKQNLDKIVESLVEHYAPESILLFGSMNDGNIH